MNALVESRRLGPIEFRMMNNPVRSWFQRNVEFRIFLRMLEKHGVDLIGRIIMDAGCGSGYSTKLIVEKFRPSGIIAFDLMPEQIRIAISRGLAVDFSVGDVTQIRSEDASVDAVFIFGILHHIPMWKKAIEEVYRVLKPEGVLLLEEPHFPEQFSWLELAEGFETAGLSILEQKSWLMGYFRSFLCRKKA
jgi:ubiquinone/menaquinone biosynthesis C-methylase UbiE